MKVQESAMDDHDDPFKGVVDDGEDDSASGKLDFSLTWISFVKLNQT